jgi:hypothetical protein
MKTKWYVRSFDDYHEIYSDDTKVKALELGCFPPKNGSYFLYYGLFYEGKRPSLSQVWKELKSKLYFGTFLKRLNTDDELEDVGMTEEEILHELREAGLRK